MLNFLKKELITNTFLFLGYSFKDNLVKKALSDIRKLLGNSLPNHYAILRNLNTANFNHYLDDLKSRYGISCILIEKYDDLPIIIRKIIKESRRKNIFFSGIFDALPNDYETIAVNLLERLPEVLLDNDCNIHTNYGRNFGNYLCGNSLHYLKTKGINHEKRLVITPFLKNMSLDDKNSHRMKTMSQCSVSIFMFGQVPVLDDNRNVIGYRNAKGMFSEEYRIARELGHIIIPIGSTGYTAQKIWQDVQHDFGIHPYLEDKVDDLNSNDIEKVICAVLKILEEAQIL
jgi:hypothetical protein